MADVRDVPGYDGKYKVSTEGHVWRVDDHGELVAVSQSQHRVCLWKNGNMWRPRVWTIVRRTFGEDAFESPDDLSVVDR